MWGGHGWGIALENHIVIVLCPSSASGHEEMCERILPKIHLVLVSHCASNSKKRNITYSVYNIAWKCLNHKWLRCVVRSGNLSRKTKRHRKKYQIRRPGSACTVFFSLCRIQNLSQNPKSKIPKLQNPKSPKSKIQNPQNPKSPKSKIQNPPNLGRWGPHIKICYITVQNPKSKIPKIQNPKSPKSKFQNPQNPKSPRSKIQNPKSPNPKSKIPQIQNPKSKIPKIQNPKSPKFGATKRFAT